MRVFPPMLELLLNVSLVTMTDPSNDEPTYPCSCRGRLRRRQGDAMEEAPSEGAGLATPRLAYWRRV